MYSLRSISPLNVNKRNIVCKCDVIVLDQHNIGKIIAIQYKFIDMHSTPLERVARGLEPILTLGERQIQRFFCLFLDDGW